MQALREMRDNKAFYGYAAGIMLPVIVQQLVSALFNFVDNFMVGILSSESLAGVSVANKPFTVFICLFFGFTGAGSILISQFYGAKDHKTTQQLFALQSIGCMVIGAVFFVILLIFPRQIMGAFITDEATMDAGMKYLRVIKYSYIPTAISMSCMHAMRSIGKNRLPMVAGFLTMLVNILLNSLLIFGLLGFPRMEEAGAALATVIARCVEAIFYIYLLWRKRSVFSLDMACVRKLPGHIVGMFIKKGIPLTTNEVFWSAGQIIFFWTFSRVQESALPALALVDQVTTIIYVLSAGMASAAITIVGNTLGAGEIEEAKVKARQLLKMAFMIALLCAGAGCILSVAVPAAYQNLDSTQRSLSTQLILVQSVCVIFSALYSTSFSVLRAGGDTRSAVLLDSVYMWVIVVPVSLICAYAFPALGIGDVRFAYITVQVLMQVKIFWALSIIKKGKWARNMTFGRELEG